MGGDFSLDSSGLTPLAELHTEVASGLSQLIGAGAPQTLEVTQSFGNIASAVNTALEGVSQSRISTISTSKSSSETIADLLGAADKMYAQGDQQGAEKLKAAAEALETAVGCPTGAGAAGGAAGSDGAAGTSAKGAAGTAGGADQAGQMAGQVGQQVGQIAGTLAQSVQGLVQGLTQLPQQVMQGVQGVVQSATQAGSSAKVDDPTAEDREDREDRDDEREAKERGDRGDKEHASREAVPAQRDEAQAGKSSDRGTAPPSPPPPVERPQPAQTRPQQTAL